MNTKWRIRTHGEPINAVRSFVRTIWSQSNLDGLLVSINGNEQAITKPRLIDDPARLKDVNPFKPLMTENSARLVPELLTDHPGIHFGALLRPCEMRSLTEMVKHDSFNLDNILTITVDCLGTFPADEYQWRVARKEATGGLAQDTLKFARQGGILAYRYRSACQMCASPEARGADLNINVLGLPIRQYILVQAGDSTTTERLHLDKIADGKAEIGLVNQHERVIARMKERHRRTMERVFQSLGDLLPKDIDALIDQLAGCGSCQQCMDVCPICAVDFPNRDLDNRYKRKDVMQWLVSCAGCGMCEQTCARHLPLSTIFGHIREMLNEEYNYTPGRSLEDPIPIP